MVKLTKAQRLALKRVYDRTPINHSYHAITKPSLMDSAIGYRAFRKAVQPGYDCIMIRWCGMWLGIERDGYTHS